MHRSPVGVMLVAKQSNMCRNSSSSFIMQKWLMMQANSVTVAAVGWLRGTRSHSRGKRRERGMPACTLQNQVPSWRAVMLPARSWSMTLNKDTILARCFERRGTCKQQGMHTHSCGGTHDHRDATTMLCGDPTTHSGT